MSHTAAFEFGTELIDTKRKIMYEENIKLFLHVVFLEQLVSILYKAFVPHWLKTRNFGCLYILMQITHISWN